MTLKSLLAVLSLAACCGPALCAAQDAAFRQDWQIQSDCALHQQGAIVSSSAFHPQKWTTTTVPSTVLAAQVAAKQFPDPYFGDNLRKLPGMDYPADKNFSNLPMAEGSPYRCGWWYRKSFQTTPRAGQRVWLHFGGINYRGELWLNGRMVAGKDKIAGAYRTYDFDVTDFLAKEGENVVAVEVFAPTEKDLGINWVDWNPCPPDKDMGLWGDVDLISTGSVTLRSPLAVTHFSDSSLKTATLTVYAELHNATGTALQAVVSGTAAGAHFQKTVPLAPHEDASVEFSPSDYPSLRIDSPKPWWPAQMGEPHLEKLSMSVQVAKITTDEKQVAFGFREMTSELTANGHRLFRVNGKRILIRGAGWTQDMLMRSDADRLRKQISMVKDMHLNTIRLEGKLETEDFFRWTDEQGILVMLGWCCCDHWEQWSSWTEEDKQIAAVSLHDQMLRLRHHASLLVWLNGSDEAPPQDVERTYLDVEQRLHWPNPLLASASSTDTPLSGPSGVKMTGPYDYVAPSYWYVDHTYGGAFGFNTETSPGPAIPSLASRQKFLPDAQAWPPSPVWKMHNGQAEFSSLAVFDDAISGTYAKPSSADAYERMAQTMSYDSERAMFEAYSRNKYTATGVVQWMLNNAWPSMVWHLYDYYLDAGAGYFATKKACEPLHIQYSYDDRSISVVNSTYAEAKGLHASVSIRDLSWHEIFHSERTLNLMADSVQQAASVPEKLYIGSNRLLVVDLSLKDESGKEVSRNFYWVPTTLTTFDWQRTDFTHTAVKRYEDLSALASLPQAEVRTDATVQRGANGREVVVDIKNVSRQLAFQLHVDARTQKGELIAPVLWSDNWVEIPPGESIRLSAPLSGEAAQDLRIEVKGWNVPSATLHPEAR